MAVAVGVLVDVGVGVLLGVAVAVASEPPLNAGECIESYRAESLKIMRDVDHKIAVAGS